MPEFEWLASNDPAAMLESANHIATVNGERIGLISDRKLRLFACACCRLVWDKLTDPRSRRAVVVAERYADGRATEGELVEAQEGADVAVCYRQSTETAHLTMAHCREMWRQQPAAQVALLRDIAGNPWNPVELPYQRACPSTCRYDDISGRVAPLSAARPFCPGCSTPWRCPWFTPNVVSLAEAAYAGEACGRCGGEGEVMTVLENVPDAFGGVDSRRQRRVQCPSCDGTGRTGGALDAHRLAVLADALEDAGCDDASILRHLREQPREIYTGHGNSELYEPVHVRGCWVVDLLLGKE